MKRSVSPLRPRARAALGMIAAAGLVGASTPVFAQTVTCGVGERVESDNANTPGTIVEVGTERPHVGWYRVVYEWNKPNGDWYDPRLWPFRPVGSRSRCTAPGSGGAQAESPKRGTAPTRPATPAPSAPGGRKTPTPETPPARPSTLDAGTYTCSAPGAGFFRIEIRDGSQYTDRAGKTGSYSFDAASGRITFSSGSLAGQYSKLLKPGKFGLASSPTGQYYTVCNLRR